MSLKLNKNVIHKFHTWYKWLATLISYSRVFGIPKIYFKNSKYNKKKYLKEDYNPSKL